MIVAGGWATGGGGIKTLGRWLPELAGGCVAPVTGPGLPTTTGGRTTLIGVRFTIIGGRAMLVGFTGCAIFAGWAVGIAAARAAGGLAGVKLGTMTRLIGFAALKIGFPGFIGILGISHLLLLG